MTLTTTAVSNKIITGEWQSGKIISTIPLSIQNLSVSIASYRFPFLRVARCVLPDDKDPQNTAGARNQNLHDRLNDALEAQRAAEEKRQKDAADAAAAEKAAQLEQSSKLQANLAQKIGAFGSKTK